MRARPPAAVAIFASLLCGCARAQDAAVPPPLPDDAAAVVERLALCRHFSGEINGDRSARDREVQEAMSRLRCEAIDDEADQLAQRYRGNPAVVSTLRKAMED